MEVDLVLAVTALAVTALALATAEFLERALTEGTALAAALDFQVALDFLAAAVLALAVLVLAVLATEALGEVSETALVLYLECSFEYLANMDLVLDPL